MWIICDEDYVGEESLFFTGSAVPWWLRWETGWLVASTAHLLWWFLVFSSPIFGRAPSCSDIRSALRLFASGCRSFGSHPVFSVLILRISCWHHLCWGRFSSALFDIAEVASFSFLPLSWGAEYQRHCFSILHSRVGSWRKIGSFHKGLCLTWQWCFIFLPRDG